MTNTAASAPAVARIERSHRAIDTIDAALPGYVTSRVDLTTGVFAVTGSRARAEVLAGMVLACGAYARASFEPGAGWGARVLAYA